MNAPIRDAFDCSSRKPTRRHFFSGFPRALLSLSEGKSSGVEIAIALTTHEILTVDFTLLYCAKLRSSLGNWILGYEVADRVFSSDVTAAMLVSLNKGTAAMLVSPTNPSGMELFYYANVFSLCLWKKKVTDHVSENTL